MKKTEWYQAKEGKAQHLVYLNKKANELQKLLNNEKTMIIRGAAGRKSPLGGRAKIGDDIFFIETDGDMNVSYKDIISDIVESEKMTEEESVAFVKRYEKDLNLSKAQYERWAGKKFLAVYKISDLVRIDTFKYRRDSNMDDWIITDDINKIKV